MGRFPAGGRTSAELLTKSKPRKKERRTTSKAICELEIAGAHGNHMLKLQMVVGPLQRIRARDGEGSAASLEEAVANTVGGSEAEDGSSPPVRSVSRVLASGETSRRLSTIFEDKVRSTVRFSQQSSCCLVPALMALWRGKDTRV